jgi:hypothetical protein
VREAGDWKKGASWTSRQIAEATLTLGSVRGDVPSRCTSVDGTRERVGAGKGAVPKLARGPAGGGQPPGIKQGLGRGSLRVPEAIFRVWDAAALGPKGSHLGLWRSQDETHRTQDCQCAIRAGTGPATEARSSPIPGSAGGPGRPSSKRPTAPDGRIVVSKRVFAQCVCVGHSVSLRVGGGGDQGGEGGAGSPRECQDNCALTGDTSDRVEEASERSSGGMRLAAFQDKIVAAPSRRRPG